MKKKDFFKLVISIVGTLIFGIGMCCCLIPEWEAFNCGIFLATFGGIILLFLSAIGIKEKLKGKSINWKFIGKILFGVFATLVLGTGMALIMVWKMILCGIVVGIVGIVLLLLLIPMCVGFIDEKK